MLKVSIISGTNLQRKLLEKIIAVETFSNSVLVNDVINFNLLMAGPAICGKTLTWSIKRL